MVAAALFLSVSTSLDSGGIAWALLLAVTARNALANVVLVPRLIAASSSNVHTASTETATGHCFLSLLWKWFARSSRPVCVPGPWA